jgi:hypothetical protein
MHISSLLPRTLALAVALAVASACAGIDTAWAKEPAANPDGITIDAHPPPPGVRVFVGKVPDEATWKHYSRTMGSDEFGKYVLDLRSGQIYYFDVNLYRLHTDFVFGAIIGHPPTDPELIAFIQNYEAKKPRFILGYLTHHLKVDEWTFSFWEGDKIEPADLERARKKLRKTFFMHARLKFRPDSPLQERMARRLRGVPIITNDKIYKAAAFQAFNEGDATGKLRIVPAGTRFEDLVFNRDEIVILQESYPDITPVSGIVSTIFSTPLSHVNLRAKEWGIPNAGIKGAAATYKALDGKIVVLHCTEAKIDIREATRAEIDAWHAAKVAARTIQVPRADLSVRDLRLLADMHASDARIYGTKGANLGEIVSHLPPGVRVPAGFGIPFVFYQEHLVKHGLDKRIASMLADPRWASDAAWRKGTAEKLKQAIIAAPLDKAVLDAVWAKIGKDLGGKGVFVRSSTNAEDLEGFNGAGLYDTIPNVTTRAQLDTAIKTVWASVWNYAAIEERSLFGIDQRYVYGGILVHIGVNATAAGVLITKNLYDAEDHTAYTINAKRGLGLRVVAGTTIPEQVIFDTLNYGTKIVSRSDDPTMLVFDEQSGGVKEVPNTNKDVILTEYHAYVLAMACKAIVPLFSRKYPLDIEWVLQGDSVWIVQARPFMSH